MRPIAEFNFSAVGGLSGMASIAFTLSGSGDMPSWLTMWPRYLTRSAKSVHLSAPKVKLLARSLVNSMSSVWRCSISVVRPNTRRSSMYASTWVHFMVPSILSMYLQNTALAVLRPIGIRLYCFRPSGVWNAVYFLQSASRGTDQKASLMSSVEK